MTTILLYHQIADLPPDRNPQHLAVTPQVFAQQMAYLQRAGYRTLSLADLVLHLRTQRRPRGKTVCITFDDGFQDLYHTAWPILRRYGFTPTVFLVAEQAGSCSDWEGQRNALAAPLLSWPEVHELADAGWTFGSHTLTHRYLPRLDEAEIVHEVTESRLQIADRLGKPVDLFAYPYGASDERVRRIVAASGYLAACGVVQGGWSGYNLWRAEIRGNDTLLSFKLKLHGWETARAYLRQWLRARPLLWRLVQLQKRLRPLPGAYNSQ